MLLLAVFVALGTWQVERRTWKLALIERVEQRVRADPIPAPDAHVAVERLADDWEYRRVSVVGRFLPVADVYTQAVTEFGAGFWVLSPLKRPNGEVVIVNRGFVAAKPAAAPAPGVQTVVGLLRRSEPKGGFLRHNEPSAERWFSRDVEAMATARGLVQVAPFFVDAGAGTEAARATEVKEGGGGSGTAKDSGSGSDTGTGTGTDSGTGTGAGTGTGTGTGSIPIAGLTVVRFSNSHLVYALTWYALAALCLVGMRSLAREDQRRAGPLHSDIGR